MKNNSSIFIFPKIKKKFLLKYLDRRILSTNFKIKYYSLNFFYKIKKIFIKAICIIHVTKNKNIKIIVINPLKKNIFIKPNRVLVCVNIIYKYKIKWVPTKSLKKSKRGLNCFGSTGI